MILTKLGIRLEKGQGDLFKKTVDETRQILHNIKDPKTSLDQKKP